MKIKAIPNCNLYKNQNFGAKLDTNTKIMINKANSLGIDTSKMEKLMKEVYPDGLFETQLYYDDGKVDVVKIDLLHKIGKHSFDTKLIFKNFIDYMPPFYLVPKQDIGIKPWYIKNITENLKRIKKETSK